MTGEALTIENITVGYGATPVLEDLSLRVEPAEFVALLGSSGCGKTTLLRSVSGFVPVAAGRILVAGRNIAALPPEKRDMAMVFQSYALWPHMTAAQNVAYGLRLRRVPRDQRTQRVAEVLALLGLEGFGDRAVTQLSGGQRQRVALGRALAVNPRILLLDEPLSNLDARIRLAVRHEIKALQQQLGITAIHVTHDREEAMVMADRIAIMNAGEIEQYGTPEEVYELPASPFVAAFMGADNVIELDVEAVDGGVRIAAGANNEAVALPRGNGAGTGVHAEGPIGRRATAHFRGEAARLVAVDETPPDSLTLRGRIAQVSYPGGVYRYAVDIGAHHVMVDDPGRLAVGEAVAISLPAAALHLYAVEARSAAATGPGGGQANNDPSS